MTREQQIESLLVSLPSYIVVDIPVVRHPSLPIPKSNDKEAILKYNVEATKSFKVYKIGN